MTHLVQTRGLEVFYGDFQALFGVSLRVEPGQVVSAGSGVLFRMAQGGQMELLAQLSESDLAVVPVGARAIVTPVGTAQSFTGTVWQISPVISEQSRQGLAPRGEDRCGHPGRHRGRRGPQRQ